MITVGVDLDGVLYPFVHCMRVWLWRSGHDGPKPSPVQWSLSEEWGMTRSEFEAQMDDALEAGWLFESQDPIQGAVEAMDELVKLARVHLVTNRPIEARVPTLRWLARHGVPYDGLWFAKDKAVDGPLCAMYIDDRPDNYDALEAAGMNPYLMGRSWNLEHPGRRVYSMPEFVEVVRERGDR